MDDQQSDSDALASALGAIGASNNAAAAHHFHHQLQQPDFSHKGSLGQEHDHHVVDVHSLDIPVGDGSDVSMHHHHRDGDFDLGLDMQDVGDDTPARTNSFGRPPSIRKACDLCHAAKQVSISILTRRLVSAPQRTSCRTLTDYQKCSGDRPSCTRCTAGGWACVYAPRQRRRTVPKEQKIQSIEQHRSPNLSALTAAPTHHHHHPMKKRKMGSRDDLDQFGSNEMDMKMAMGMAVDLGLAGEEEGEEMLTMTDDQMLESIAIDGYLADLPLATFVHNLPYTAGQNGSENNYGDEYAGGGENAFQTQADMDQHTTSALRDAIFSLNESSNANQGGEGQGEDGQGGDGQGENGEGLDPHLALLDLSHAMPVEGDGEGGEGGNEHLNLNFGQHNNVCPHVPLVTHVLALITQHALEPKPGSNTPLTLGVFAPLARSLRLFHAISHCPSCSTSPQQTLPQLALISRTTTILTFPYPPINSSSVGSSAQITVHGARLSGTGLSEAIEQHIVGVVWDSWRAAIREIFAALERKAQEVITQSAASLAAEGGNGGSSGSATGAETQRAGLMFQAMSRLVTAMDEVEGN